MHASCSRVAPECVKIHMSCHPEVLEHVKVESSSKSVGARKNANVLLHRGTGTWKKFMSCSSEALKHIETHASTPQGCREFENTTSCSPGSPHHIKMLHPAPKSAPTHEIHTSHCQRAPEHVEIQTSCYPGIAGAHKNTHFMLPRSAGAQKNVYILLSRSAGACNNVYILLPRCATAFQKSTHCAPQASPEQMEMHASCYTTQECHST